MAESEKPNGGAFVLLIVIIAAAIGIGTAAMNANTPLAKSHRELRQAEDRAETACRQAGCPSECRSAGFC